MESREERLDETQLRAMSTGELLRHAIAEARLLVKAEVLHAKQELKDELKAAKLGGMLLGVALGLGLCGLAILFATVAVALPIPEWLSFLIVGGVLLACAAICGVLGYKNLPRKPLPRTQERIKADISMTREQLA